MTSSIGVVLSHLNGLPPLRFCANEYLEGTMKFDRDFSEFVTSFIANDVQFLIVGGYALAAHGLPRATGDLDVWVLVNPENAQKVLRALEEFGFTNLGLTADDFNRSDSVIQLGYPPYRIDILTSIDGVDFNDAWVRRTVVNLDGAAVPFIGREDLVTNKRTVGRPQDIADIARLTGSNDGSEV